MDPLGESTLAAFINGDSPSERYNASFKVSGGSACVEVKDYTFVDHEARTEPAEYCEEPPVPGPKNPRLLQKNGPTANGTSDLRVKHFPNGPTASEDFITDKCNAARSISNEKSTGPFDHRNATDKSNFESIGSLGTSGRSKNDKTCSESVAKDFTLDNTEENSKNSVEIFSKISAKDRCKLASWGLPMTILQKYKARGIGSMFAWQVECLSNRRLLEKSCNLVYSAPTSAGKTLVAEILLIKTALERRKKVLFILPFVSVVREKMYYFQDLLAESGLRVEGFMGGISPVEGFAATDIAVATIEKANSLVNRLMEEGDLSSLGAVVIDELHLLGDAHRGYLLELLLTKLKYMNLREELIRVQIIGMSATLPNLGVLARWLDAEVYSTEFRPVPLSELCKIGTTIYDDRMKKVRDLPVIPSLIADPENILQLCIETISEGHSILIFCPTKSWCEKLALQIASGFCKLGRENTPIGRTLRAQLSVESIVETMEQLKRSPTGLDNVLKSTVAFGAGFHHAGLTMDERDVIEGAFRTGALRILTATSTLSSGVNLPARRVIVRSLMFNGKPLDTMTYKQMIGRAGRMGKDTAGESILVCKSNEISAARNLLVSALPPIESCLKDSMPLVRAILEAVASDVAYTAKDIDLYTSCTLASLTSNDLIRKSAEEAVKYLIDNELCMPQGTENGGRRWIATQLGKACLAASMPPLEGLFLFEELQRARRCFVLDTELHVVYLVTPLNSSNQIGQIDWFVFLDLWRNMTESERRVGQLVGVDENFLVAAIRDPTRSSKIIDVHKRFYTALVLHELVREIPLGAVCQKYGVSRGLVQSLQQSAATFAGMVTQFCKKLGWSCMELLINQFQIRLQFGVCHELLDLLQLPLLNGLRARSLFKEGITSVAELALADTLDVERGLYKALPFESSKKSDGQHEHDVAKRNKMRSVFVTGRDGLTPHEAAILLVQEARCFLENKFGVDGLQWKQRERLTGVKECSNATRDRDSRNGLETEASNAANCTDDDPKSTEKGPSAKVETGPSVEEHVSRIETFTSKQTNSDGSSIFDVLDNLKPSANGKSVDTTKNSIKEGKHGTTWEDTWEFINLPEVIDSEGILSGTNVGVDDNEKLILASISTGIKLDPSEDDTGYKAREELCDKGISRITHIADADDSKNIIGSKESNGVLAEDIFGFTPTENEIDPEVAGITDSITSKDICEKDLCKFDNTGNVINPKYVAEPKSFETVAERNCDFSYTPSPENYNNSKNAPGSTHSYEICNKRSTFSGSRHRTIDPEAKTLGHENKSATSRTISLLESLTKEQDSQSPDLFSDSLNINTQECNMLEENVFDSLNVSAFADSNILRSIQLKKPTPENCRPNETRSKSSRRKKKCTERSLSLKDSMSRRSAGALERTERKSFVWDDDSWNNTNAVIETVDISNSPVPSSTMPANYTGHHKVPPHNKIPEKVERTASSLITTINVEDRLFLKNRVTGLEKLPRKRKLNASSIEISPTAGIVVKIPEARKLSVDSAKSDSDDPVILSQRTRSLTSNTHSKTRSKLESLRKTRVRQSRETKESKESHYEKDFSCGNWITESIQVGSAKSQMAQATTRSAPRNGKNCISRKRHLQCAKTNGYESTKKTPPSIFFPQEINVISVAADWTRFDQFKENVAKEKDISLALACEIFLPHTVSIGTKIIGVSGIDGNKKHKKVENGVYGNRKISGVAISWDGIAAHYIPFDNTHESKVPVKERLDLLVDILNSSHLTICCFSSKETYKILYNCCRIAPACKFLDPKMADWLLNTENSDRSFNTLIAEHFPEAEFMSKRTGTCLGGAGPGLNVKSTVRGEIRATTEAVLTWHLTRILTMKLEACSSALLETFRLIEMETVMLLARMELTGLGINLKSLQELSSVIQQEIVQLENKAYSQVGKKFNFSSSKSVAQVLGFYKGQKVSTKKTVLEHLENPLSRLVIVWRKLHTTQIKVVYPLIRLAECDSRIHGNCITETVTGRVSMHELNLQNVPRDFNSHDDSFSISVRMAFLPMHGNVLLSADYCQLELRILAHLSKEVNLCRVLRKEGDVFKNIAARWYNVAAEKIDDRMRQKTKQLCYGMIYGMGIKSLAENLAVTEPEAKEFLETFMTAYPGIRQWVTQTVDTARSNGYVTTLVARRRFLPALNSESARERSQAERQAVNTIIQGSAADITKKAMVLIDQRICREFPNRPLILAELPIKQKLRNGSGEELSRGAWLVLQIHDELLYEVNSRDLQQVGRIIKESMETSFELTVPLPVRIKVGKTWGDLSETTF